MENIIDALQIKINAARKELSEDSRIAIDSINWKLILLEIGKKYNSDQLDYLKIEMELLLCGLLSTKNFPSELENRMGINKEESSLLIKDLDKLIFKIIQKKLEEIIHQKEKKEKENGPVVFDPRFSNMPDNVQEAIAESNWRENLYKISQKYKLSIVQMGDLEDITTKVISNVIHPDKYESEVAFKIIIPKNDISNLVNDINNEILMKIRKSFKEKIDNNNRKQEESRSEKIEDEIPLPPYKNIIKNEELGIKNLDKKEKESNLIKIESKNNIIVKEANKIDIPEKKIEKQEDLEIPRPIIPFAEKNDSQKELENIIKTIPFPVKKEMEDKKTIEEIKITPKMSDAKNIQPTMMEEKLRGNTVNNQTVSDYSVPPTKIPSSKSNDPYREVL